MPLFNIFSVAWRLVQYCGKATFLLLSLFGFGLTSNSLNSLNAISFNWKSTFAEKALESSSDTILNYRKESENRWELLQCGRFRSLNAISSTWRKHIHWGRFGDNIFLKEFQITWFLDTLSLLEGGAHDRYIWSLSIKENKGIFVFRCSFSGVLFQVFVFLVLEFRSLFSRSFYQKTGVWLHTLSLLERLKPELDISGEKP